MPERYDPAAQSLHLYTRRITSLADIAMGDPTPPHGWHGTSVEAAAYLNRYYRLPAGELDGSVLFYARCGFNPTEAMQVAKTYAKINAVKQYVRQQLLPFKPSNPHTFSGALEFESADREKFLEEASRAGVTEADFLRHLRTAQATRHGVLLGISATADRDFPQLSAGQAHENEVALETSGGLPIKYITNVLPLGSYESDVISELRRNPGANRGI